MNLVIEKESLILIKLIGAPIEINTAFYRLLIRTHKARRINKKN